MWKYIKIIIDVLWDITQFRILVKMRSILSISMSKQLLEEMWDWGTYF